MIAWLLTVAAGQSDTATLAMGFIPARFSGLPVPWPALPAFLTPLSATLVHSGFIHHGFHMLILLWGGTAVEALRLP